MLWWFYDDNQTIGPHAETMPNLPIHRLGHNSKRSQQKNISNIAVYIHRYVLSDGMIIFGEMLDFETSGILLADCWHSKERPLI